MPVPPETCAACGFDGADYGLQDAINTLRSLPTMWQQVVEGTDERVLLTRPAPDKWSAAELTAHSADVVEAMGRLLHGIRTVDDLAVEAVPEAHAPDVSAGFAPAMARLHANVTRLHAGALRAGPERDPGWQRTALAGGHAVDGAWVLRHAIHDATHHLMDVGRGLHRLGAGPATHTGTVAQISTSLGGVPKRPIDMAQIGRRGVVGDRQATRQHHGRPFQALCLWSSEVIDALRSEGHPIEPGFAGENLTLSGIDWSTLRPGVRLRIGDVLAELSAWSTPCQKNAAWFVDGDVSRIHHERHPGWSRAYAWVRRPGTVRTGDEAVVEP